MEPSGYVRQAVAGDLLVGCCIEIARRISFGVLWAVGVVASRRDRPMLCDMNDSSSHGFLGDDILDVSENVYSNVRRYGN